MTYAWLRDLIPIAGAKRIRPTRSKARTPGHHLQCQVTATDGGGSATAKSAFVTIPVGGVPASAGETAVGKARASRSGKLSVPIACSAQASERLPGHAAPHSPSVAQRESRRGNRGPLDTQHPRGRRVPAPQ